MDLEQFKPIIEKLNFRLEKIIKEISKENSQAHFTKKSKDKIEKAYSFLQKFLINGGKRLRPLLIILVSKACGAKEEDSLYDAALSGELVHNSTLIQDDFMDGDKWRRGKPTIHEMCKKNYEKYGKDPYPNFKNKKCANAVSEATILGNILLSEGISLISKNKNALEDLNKTYLLINQGQILDFYMEDSEYYLDMAYHKTAILFACCARIGAYLAGKNKKEAQEVGEAILPGARAFQIQDDILDTSEDRADKKGSDIKNGRNNLVQALFFENATEKEKEEFLNKYFGKKELSKEEVDRAVKILESSGAVKLAKEKRDKYLDESINKIEKLQVKNKKDLILYVKTIALREK